jgi:hypothetical protein
MDVIAKIKEKLLDRIVEAALALIVLLFSIIYLAVPSEVWGRVSEVVPKRALWALLGLATIAICFLVGALIDNWRKNRHVPMLLPAGEPVMLKRFGVLWDKDQNPHCPVDKTYLPFYSHGVVSDHECDYLRCPACHETYPLWDSNLGGLALHDAKQFIQQDIQVGRISN